MKIVLSLGLEVRTEFGNGKVEAFTPDWVFVRMFNGFDVVVTKPDEITALITLGSIQQAGVDRTKDDKINIGDHVSAKDDPSFEGTVVFKYDEWVIFKDENGNTEAITKDDCLLQKT